MYRIAVLVLILATIAYADPYVDFLPCDSTRPTPRQVAIASCAFVPHNCTLKRGTHYDIGVDFFATFQADQVFNITGDLVCDEGIVCPVYEGSLSSYDHVWTPMNFTGSSLTQFSLVDEKQNTIVCFNMRMSE
ncbi:uncharacterized protein LOC141855968 [Brevipalpus obovatus]|uniref:uncharacterized protein LOC141855968 n=1 Tax=Brevipalpus obovatus TaxID=246614 RepID=UPI003D9E4C70